jgi:hypothetical protein
MPFSNPLSHLLMPDLNRQDQWQRWIDIASRLGYPALALVVFALLWRACHRAGSAQPWTTNVNAANGHHSGNGNGNGNGVSSQPAEPSPSVITVEVLNRLIRENPANMTQAVRTWLGRGGSPK